MESLYAALVQESGGVPWWGWLLGLVFVYMLLMLAVSVVTGRPLQLILRAPKPVPAVLELTLLSGVKETVSADLLLRSLRDAALLKNAKKVTIHVKGMSAGTANPRPDVETDDPPKDPNP